MIRVLLPSLCCVVVLGGAEDPPAEAMPASPATVPGLRILPQPGFTHWPAIAYVDEARNAAFTIPCADPVQDAKRDRPVVYVEPVPRAGAAGTIGWEGSEGLPFALPVSGEGSGGLIDLVLRPGRQVAVLTLATAQPLAAGNGWEPVSRMPTGPGPGLTRRMPLHIVAVEDEWPLAALRGSYPVDAEGVPVVLLDQRRTADQERRLAVLRPVPSRPAGRPLVVGDPLTALGRDAWEGLDADLRPALDERRPEHAVLVALAQALNRTPAGGAALTPRTLIWSPGNAGLLAGPWSGEEERLLRAIRGRCDALGFRPRLVLLLPPWPIGFAEEARSRRETLRRSAAQLGWVVIDAARAAGDGEDANRVGEAVFTRYPVGEAQQAIRNLIAQELTR
jgi:hypothetical protein